MNERIKELRKALGLSGEKFGERLGIKRAAVSKIELGENNVTAQLEKLICREFNVNPDWLKSGKGDMFIELPPEDEVGVLVSQLIDGDNPLFDIILETMRTFNQLTPDNQKIISSYCEQLLHNLKDKKES